MEMETQRYSRIIQHKLNRTNHNTVRCSFVSRVTIMYLEDPIISIIEAIFVTLLYHRFLLIALIKNLPVNYERNNYRTVSDFRLYQILFLIVKLIYSQLTYLQE
jgi:hypothetical protein